MQDCYLDVSGTAMPDRAELMHLCIEYSVYMREGKVSGANLWLTNEVRCCPYYGYGTMVKEIMHVWLLRSIIDPFF